jgi:hypothetical protein
VNETCQNGTAPCALGYGWPLAVAKETVMLREDQLATRRRVTGIGRLLRLGCLVLLAALGSASALAAGADTSVVVTVSANIGGHSPWPKLQEA